ncbi:MAG: HlyD family efflux transporter periplasmic adaptor subunit [Betaproteobacteria bacterium]|nr:HlyD family efflux transporter periplasmic adaptor subunit [Betaproteobacteria bacterium]
MTRIRIAVVAISAWLGLAAGQAFAHGDEDHTVAVKAKPSEASLKQANASGRSQHSKDAEPAAAAKSAATGVLPAEATAAQRLPDGSLFVPKAVQRQLGLRHVLAHIDDLAATVEFNGKVIADPNAGGRVQATQSGRLEAGPKGLPTLGRKVVKGEVLAYLRPVASSIERGNQQAQLAEIDAQLAIAQRKLSRYEQLEGMVSKSATETVRFEVDALNKRRAAVGASLGAAEPLVAPVSGVIAAAYVLAGQVVEAKEILFEVIDPARLAVEALAYDAALAEGIATASAPLPGGALELRFIGGGRQLREQAIPLLFRVVPPHPQPLSREGRGEHPESLRDAHWTAPVAVGQPLKVIAQTARKIRAAAVPHAALVKVGAGESALWVRDGAERFVLRKVDAVPLDATRVAVIKGLEAGERVVSEGASLLAQVR